MKILIAMDFDGVINPVPREDENIKLGSHYKDVELIDTSFGGGIEMKFNVKYDPEIVAYINTLIENPIIDFRWHTTWQRDTEQFPAMLGFKEALWMPAQRQPNVHEIPKDDRLWWKHYTLKQLTEIYPDRKFLWIDDHIGYDINSLKWLTDNTQVKWLNPNYRYGLVQEDILVMERFIRENS